MSLIKVIIIITTIIIRIGSSLRTSTKIPSSPSTIDLSQANCRKSLGMQSGSIEDKFITASSSYDVGSVGPANARIRTEKNGGAWCPRQPISKDSYEWIQVDLLDLKVITQVETQGRFGSGQGQEYVEQYRLEFKRKNSGHWMKYKDKRYIEIFKGNNNTYIAELREINPPLVARKVRIVPIIPLSGTVCLRFELYGCAWRDGVVSYSVPQGDKFSDDLHLFDYTYDGPPTHAPNFLSGGLGQLTDGAEGHSNFRLDPDGSGKKGYEWVGWKNDTGRADDDDDDDDELESRLSVSKASASNPGDGLQRRNENRRKSDDVIEEKNGGVFGEVFGEMRFRGSVRILFEFDKLRNFTACRIHCNNMFSKEVRLFKRATLHFSADGLVFKGSDVIRFENGRDSLIEFARNVIIPINGVVGRVVVVDLHHDSRWIMVSEVRFESDVIATYEKDKYDDDYDDDDDADVEEGPTGSELRNGHVSDKEGELSIHSSILSSQHKEDGNNEQTSSLKNVSVEQNRHTSSSSSSSSSKLSHSTALLDKVVGVISGVIVAMLFIIIFVIVLFATKKNNNNNINNVNNVNIVANNNSNSQEKSFYRICCHCCHKKYKVPNNDGAVNKKKASLDLSICDSWHPSMRKVVSNGNTYSNLSSNGCPGDGLPLTTDDVIWRADKFLMSRNNRKLPDLPGKLFLESSLITDVCDIVSTSSTYAIPEFSRTEVLRRQNSFCQSKSSPHLHHKTPPFSIFIPPPPPLNPSHPKFQTPQAMTDHISTNQRTISSLRHKGQTNRCEDENPSNVPTNKEDFYTHVTSKLQELTTPLLGHDDVIFLQCLGTGDFGKLDLCELKKEETEKDIHPSRKKDEDKECDDVRMCVKESKDSPESYSKTTITCYDGKPPQDVHKRWTVEKKKRFLVAVKSLKYEDEEHRRHFLSEMERSSKTKNENIAQLLGVCMRGEEGPALVYEFTKNGDLVQFLRGCVLADQVPQIGPEADTLSHGCLTHLGCQVASGMKYLEKCGLVHGDLSARNCLVGPRRLVKICDLARWRSNYRGDYFPPHPWSPPLPVRWMAWEAIHMNEATSSKSDVWSFGVTMWEILSLARLKPYHWLTDEQVIANIFNRKHVTEDVGQSETGSFCNKQKCWQQSQQFVKKQPPSFQIQQIHDFRNTLQDITSRDNSNFPATPQATCSQLPQPIGCSKEIYDLLIECWSQDSNSRPSFADIHLFLLRYNDGHPNTPKNCASRSDDNKIEHDV